MTRARILLVLLFGLAALPARAGLFDDDEARARIEKLREDFDAINHRVDTAAKNQIDFANQVEALRSDLANLRGQIEVITNELDAAQKRQKDFYIDLDTRLRKLEPGASAADARPQSDAPAAATADAPKATAGNETKDYEAGLAALKSAKYKDALAAFQGFIKNYPDSNLQPSAHYWAASSYYQMKDYGRAADLFGVLAKNWPNDAKAPDALLAAANAQIEAGDTKTARGTLESLVAKYPSSNAAASAKSRLKSLPPAHKKK
jgi:tol-pal system protein YbgF